MKVGLSDTNLEIGKRTLTVYPCLQFDWFGFSSFSNKHSNYNIFYFLVKSNPVKLESRRTVIPYPYGE